MSKRSREEEDINDTESIYTSSQRSIECTIPPCHLNPPTFRSYMSYENHVVTYHNYICNECYRRFPSDTFLNLHIDENHNPFLQLKKENGLKIFKCFHYSSQGCKKICSTPSKRRLHMIDKHKYPKEFNFNITNQGLNDNEMFLLKI